MREIKCRDIGVDCDFTARGNSDEEVLANCRAHGKQAHGMDKLDPDLEAKVRRSIHDAR